MKKHRHDLANMSVGTTGTTAMTLHASDCSVHNTPLAQAECNCGADGKMPLYARVCIIAHPGNYKPETIEITPAEAKEILMGLDLVSLIRAINRKY